MDERRNPAPPSDAGRAAIDQNRRSHDVLTAAQEHLYSALAEAQVGRERDWAERVTPKVAAARDALARHAAEVRSPGGLYEELQLDAPWLSGRLEDLDRELDTACAQVDALMDAGGAAETDPAASVAPVRERCERLLARLRAIITEENELVYERWRETPAMD